jgi:L-serine kinase (ADP)
MTTGNPEFALVPIGRLLAHEKVDPAKVDELVEEFRADGVFVDPIWVARGSDVILNGHHRVAALRKLGATRVPAWLLDYEDDGIALERWTPGPTITKDEVVRRARAGRLFPIKTTRHRLADELPAHPTPIAELRAVAAAQPRASKPSRSRGAGVSDSG